MIIEKQEDVTRKVLEEMHRTPDARTKQILSALVTHLHDFVRDSVRAALMKARPAPHFTAEIAAHPTASQALSPGAIAPGTRCRP